MKQAGQSILINANRIVPLVCIMVAFTRIIFHGFRFPFVTEYGLIRFNHVLGNNN